MVWIDVTKAYDSIEHRWLVEIFTLHRFPAWFCKILKKLDSRKHCSMERDLSANKIQEKTASRGVCLTLFTQCINPISWMLRATEGQRLTKPIANKITHLLYIDNLKIFAATENKLKRMMTLVKVGIGSICLKWNKKKCPVSHMKRGQIEQKKTTRLQTSNP